MIDHVLPWALYWLGAVSGNIWPALLAAFIALFLIYVPFRKFFASRKVQPSPIDWRQLQYEVVFAILTLGAGVLTQLALQYLIQHKHATLLTTPLSSSIAALIVFQVVLYLALYDIYFYFLHRLFHIDLLYKTLHKYHHKTESPDPVTAFSFHPLEGVITGSFILVMVTCFDMHAYAIAIVGVFATLNSVMLHSGHEIFPSWWNRSRLAKYYITPTYHDRHHQLYRKNFGAFTNIWDRMFGTMDPDHLSYYDEVHTRIRSRTALVKQITGDGEVSVTPVEQTGAISGAK